MKLSFALLSILPLTTADFTYVIDRTVPCTNGCTGDMTISGTVTFPALGPIADGEASTWDVEVTSSNVASGSMTPPVSGSASVSVGSGSIVATECELIVTIPPFDETNSFAVFGFFGAGSWQIRGGSGEVGVEALTIFASPNQRDEAYDFFGEGHGELVYKFPSVDVNTCDRDGVPAEDDSKLLRVLEVKVCFFSLCLLQFLPCCCYSINHFQTAPWLQMKIRRTKTAMASVMLVTVSVELNSSTLRYFYKICLNVQTQFFPFVADCFYIPNADQLDSDGDGTGDACACSGCYYGTSGACKQSNTVCWAMPTTGDCPPNTSPCEDGSGPPTPPAGQCSGCFGASSGPCKAADTVCHQLVHGSCPPNTSPC